MASWYETRQRRDANPPAKIRAIYARLTPESSRDPGTWFNRKRKDG